MTIGLQTAAYLSATVLFILALGGLSNQEKAKRAVWFGIIGMAIAVLATVAGSEVSMSSMLIGAIVIGAVIGAIVAMRVEMTGMPQLVAALHSFVGLAAVFIGINSDLSVHDFASEAARIIHEVEIFLGVFIGAVTFTGSIIAYGKLAGKIGGKALILPGRHLWNLVMVGGSFVLMLMYMNHAGSWTLYVMTLLALLLGAHLVMAIGGADMPVVVSMLNSYSGWAAAATGFLLGNDLLIVTGALVGSSGAILSYIMCKAMNRHFLSVILGGWGDATGPAMEIEGEQVAIDVDGVASALDDADSVIIVPGYGMAVAQAQQSVSELTRRLRAKGKEVRFAIHPVAGRLPG
ncbi:MAG: NAD(P)(+) transhydrogenase (Re/Si-specific) subunit beta, partial [Litorivicinaceae bacterium]